MVRRYAPVVGVVILLLGPAGRTLGDQQLGGALHIDLAEDLVHLVTGGLLASVGFAPVAPGRRRTVGAPWWADWGCSTSWWGCWASSTRPCSACSPAGTPWWTT